MGQYRSLSWFVIALLTPVVASASRLVMSHSTIAHDAGTLGEEIFFVSATGKEKKGGCSSLSVVSLATGSPVFSGKSIQPFTRIAASGDYSRIVVGPRDGGLFRYHALDRDDSSATGWSDRSIRCTYEGIDPLNRPATLLSDDGRYLYTTVYNKEQGSVGVGQFDLEDLVLDVAGNLMLNKMIRYYDTEPFIATRAFFAPGSKGVVHFLGIAHARAGASVQTLDLVSGDLVSTPIKIESMMIPDGPTDLTFAFADLSKDGRFLVTNLWHKGGINVVDLDSRTSKVVVVDGTTTTGGVAINRGWENSGVLAVHAGSHVQLLRLDQVTGDVQPLSSLPVDGPRHDWPPYHQVPAQVAWSTSGAQLIVSVDHKDSEFLIVNVSDEGNRMEIARFVTVCQDDGKFNKGLDILTCNGEFDEIPQTGSLDRCFVPRSVSPTATQQEPSPSPVISPPNTHTPLPPRPVLLPVLANG